MHIKSNKINGPALVDRLNNNVTTMLIKPTRNSSRDETENVNFLYQDIVHALPNTIDCA